jgi:hypothetical protein
MSVLAYRGAIATAQGHSTLLATAFDLHRFDMLQALHYELPPTPISELALNRQLSDFLGTPHGDVRSMGKFRYGHPPSVADSIGRLAKPDGTGSKP